MTRNAWIALIAVALLACCCVCVAAVGIGGFVAYRTTSTQVGPVLTSFIPLLTESAATDVPTAVPNIVRTPVPSPVAGGPDTLTTLEKDVVPPSDLRELAMRLKGIPSIPEVVSTAPANYALGDETEFYITNMDTKENRKFSAQLIYETENVYFFTEKGVDVNETDVKSLVDEFQNKTYPTDREFFGSEWRPGVDGDPHLYMLYARGIGGNAQAYFDSASEYSRLAHPFSNEKEIFVLNADAGSLNDPYWRPTLAHEFQHMIHWYHDRNEETWMNEGSSMLAEEINGFDVGSIDSTFLGHPDLQLNTWSDLSLNYDNATAHYGAAYLFMKYFLDRFGEKATQALVANPANGLLAVDDTLASLKISDPATGQTLTADNVFADWTVANFLNDSGVSDGRYAYKNYTNRVSQPTETVDTCPEGPTSNTVRQFGTDYIEIKCKGALTVDFTGSLQAQIVPTKPHGGRYAFWSNRSDESDTNLTRDFDLSGTTKATLEYWAWWQIEENYDFAYVEVSTDGGQTWKTLRAPSSTDNNTTGANMGWGYTGCSGVGGDPGTGCQAEWVKESVDLSAYAGQKIKVRFEYVTDAALDYPSLMLDDISIPEINDSCDVEKDACGWQAEGFARIDNLLPQTFIVQVIQVSGGQTTVTPVTLDANNQGQLPLNLKQDDQAILVVSGATPFTTEPASYEYQIK
jgi:immune inhibitor A